MDVKRFLTRKQKHMLARLKEAKGDLSLFDGASQIDPSAFAEAVPIENDQLDLDQTINQHVEHHMK